MLRKVIDADDLQLHHLIERPEGFAEVLSICRTVRPRAVEVSLLSWGGDEMQVFFKPEDVLTVAVSE